ncbi:MAG: hypothetical protein ABW034_07700 [Steroidobacteraceae bacterium]
MSVNRNPPAIAAVYDRAGAGDFHETEFDAEALFGLGVDDDPIPSLTPVPRHYDGQRTPITPLEALELEQTIDDLQRLVWPEWLASK